MRVFYSMFAPISTILTVFMIWSMMEDPIIPAAPAHATPIAGAFGIAAYMICATVAAWHAAKEDDE